MALETSVSLETLVRRTCWPCVFGSAGRLTAAALICEYAASASAVAAAAPVPSLFASSDRQNPALSVQAQLEKLRLISRPVKRPLLTCICDPFLWLSGIAGAYSPHLHDWYGIRLVISVGQRVSPDFQDVRIRYEYLHVDDLPSADIVQHFATTFKWIEEARLGCKAVLVHCYAGLSRSVTVVAAYLARRHSLQTSHDAYLVIRKTGHSIAPNHGFREQLDTFCKANYTET